MIISQSIFGLFNQRSPNFSEAIRYNNQNNQEEVLPYEKIPRHHQEAH